MVFYITQGLAYACIWSGVCCVCDIKIKKNLRKVGISRGQKLVMNRNLYIMLLGAW